MGSFYGADVFAIDHKGRVAIPARLRRALSPEAHETFVITPGLDRCLALYPLDEWQIYEHKLRGLPIGNDRARLLKRKLLAHAADVQVDAQGRVTLPSKLMQWANLGKEALIVGAVDHIEIYDPDHFEAITEGPDADVSLEKLAEEFLS